MKLTSLVIQENASYQPNPGKYRCTVGFRNDNGNIELNLHESTVQKIISLCADGLVSSVKETAEIMKANIIDSVAAIGTQLEDKSKEEKEDIPF